MDIGKELTDGLRDFRDALERGEPVEVTQVTREETPDGPLHTFRKITMLPLTPEQRQALGIPLPGDAKVCRTRLTPAGRAAAHVLRHQHMPGVAVVSGEAGTAYSWDKGSLHLGLEVPKGGGPHGWFFRNHATGDEWHEEFTPKAETPVPPGLGHFIDKFRDPRFNGVADEAIGRMWGSLFPPAPTIPHAAWCAAAGVVALVGLVIVLASR